MSDLVELSKEHKEFVRTEIRELLRQCEGVDDAKQYVGDILSDASEKFPEVETNSPLWEAMRNYVYETLQLNRTT